MSTFVIQGRGEGELNIKQYNFSYSLYLSSFDGILNSVSLPTNTKGTIVTYRPDAPIKPFQTLSPGLGYIINTKQNLIIYDITYWQDVFMWDDNEIWEDGEQLPPTTQYDIQGSTNGAYNIVDFTFKQISVNIDTFNPSLCSVVKLNDQRNGFMTYRPNSPLNLFTRFVPNSGYVVRAKENFTLT